MEQNPYADDDFPTSSEYLRLAVALLCEHSIPLTPPNYHVAYHYFSRRNADLKHAVDRALSASNDASGQLWETHTRFFPCEKP